MEAFTVAVPNTYRLIGLFQEKCIGWQASMWFTFPDCLYWAEKWAVSNDHIQTEKEKKLLINRKLSFESQKAANMRKVKQRKTGAREKYCCYTSVQYIKQL